MKAKSVLYSTLLALGLFTSCEKSDLPDRTAVATGARILFYNFSPDAPETNLYFNDQRVTTQQSTIVGKLRGIPFRSSYPGSITQTPASTTSPSPYIGAEYFIAPEGNTTIVAKDTAVVLPATTFFSTTSVLQSGKYYTILAADLKSTMSPVIIEDDIREFATIGKVRVRTVNALVGVTGSKVDVWMIHQPVAAQMGWAPYKLAANLDFKGATAFSDTITSASYKWMVVKAGAIPLTNAAPTAPGSPYNLTFNAADILINKNAAGTVISDRTTYSLLLYGQVGGTGGKTPYSSFFRNRVK